MRRHVFVVWTMLLGCSGGGHTATTDAPAPDEAIGQDPSGFPLLPTSVVTLAVIDRTPGLNSLELDAGAVYWTEPVAGPATSIWKLRRETGAVPEKVVEQSYVASYVADGGVIYYIDDLAQAGETPRGYGRQLYRAGATLQDAPTPLTDGTHYFGAWINANGITSGLDKRLLITNARLFVLADGQLGSAPSSTSSKYFRFDLNDPSTTFTPLTHPYGYWQGVIGGAKGEAYAWGMGNMLYILGTDGFFVSASANDISTAQTIVATDQALVFRRTMPTQPGFEIARCQAPCSAITTIARIAPPADRFELLFATDQYVYGLWGTQIPSIMARVLRISIETGAVEAYAADDVLRAGIARVIADAYGVVWFAYDTASSQFAVRALSY